MFLISIRQPRRLQQGAALVLILCFVVLVAGLMVAFFSRATTERQVANTNASGIKAEMLADTALDIIADELKQEITTSSTTNGSGTCMLYIPTSGSSAFPTRTETIPNLICRSNHNNTFTRAVDSNSSGVSLNGRSVTLARWNAHYLLPLASGTAVGDTTPESSFTAPDWVLVTRGGVPSGGGWSSTMANASADNSNYVIGRYAYAIYNEGGLLDMNAAGYPSGCTTDQSGPKGGIAFADLQQLGLNKTQIDQLVGWRNYACIQPSGTFPDLNCNTSSAAKFVTWLTSGSFGTVSENTYQNNTDHYFTSRQQLIQFILKLGTSTDEQTKLQGILQYLGTFTREVNGPTWAPTFDGPSPYNYKSTQFDTSPTVYNPSILSIKVKQAFTRADGSQAVPGEPLVKNRFPLEKLALLEKLQGVETLTSQNRADIARYFGLDAVNDSVEYYRHWSYPTVNTKYPHTNKTGIMSLSEVADQNREPDFFELLQAGILDGSLGRTNNEKGDISAQYQSSLFDDPDGKITLQLMRIGANIIDQWDADNYPTIITIGSSIKVYGIEDLPYLNKFLFTIRGPGTIGSPYTQQYTVACGFQLWNPHSALTSNTGVYPSNIRISSKYVEDTLSASDSYLIGLVTERKSDKKYFTWYWSGSNQAWSTGATTEYFNDLLPSKGIMEVPFDNPSTDFREPAIGGTVALPTINGMPGNALSSSGTQTYANLIANDYAGCWFYFKTSTVYRIQFQDSSGNFHTYGTFVGLDDSESADGYVQTPWLEYGGTKKDQWYSCPKSDPRTFRFRSGQSTEYDVGSSGYSINPDPSTVYSKVNSQYPFTSAGSGNYRIDRWAVNDPSSKISDFANPAYPDLDGYIRPGDAYYSASSNYISPLFTSANGGGAARPVILNRPFRSVGELGYVFRDMPWKTLDFSSKNSADAALLDLFSLNQNQAVVSGRLDPNTRNEDVLTAVIAGATQSISSDTQIPADKAKTVAKAMIELSMASPFTNRADLVIRLMNDSSLSNLSGIKTEREAVVRAIADCANTRTWNLLIDLVAQSGKYPSAANSSASPLDQFIVEGERHYWLHIAIDRYTGQVIDKQLEVVSE